MEEVYRSIDLDHDRSQYVFEKAISSSDLTDDKEMLRIFRELRKSIEETSQFQNRQKRRIAMFLWLSDYISRIHQARYDISALSLNATVEKLDNRTDEIYYQSLIHNFLSEIGYAAKAPNGTGDLSPRKFVLTFLSKQTMQTLAHITNAKSHISATDITQAASSKLYANTEYLLDNDQAVLLFKKLYRYTTKLIADKNFKGFEILYEALVLFAVRFFASPINLDEVEQLLNSTYNETLTRKFYFSNDERVDLIDPNIANIETIQTGRVQLPSEILNFQRTLLGNVLLDIMVTNSTSNGED